MCYIWWDLRTPAFLLYFRGYFERVQSNPYYLHHHDIVCRLWTFNVSPLLGIGNQINVVMVVGCIGGARPVPQVWCRPWAWAVTAWPCPAAAGRACPAAVPGRPPIAYGGRSELRPRTWQTGLPIRSIALRERARCAHNMERRGLTVIEY